LLLGLGKATEGLGLTLLARDDAFMQKRSTMTGGPAHAWSIHVHKEEAAHLGAVEMQKHDTTQLQTTLSANVKIISIIGRRSSVGKLLRSSGVRGTDAGRRDDAGARIDRLELPSTLSSSNQREDASRLNKRTSSDT
jgi:hypothetical protein